MPRVECEQCYHLGHNVDKYPFKKDINAIMEAKCGTNLYERQTIVNGHKIKGLLDAGSSCSVLRKSIVEKYKLPIAITPDNVLRNFAGQVTTSSQSAFCDIRGNAPESTPSWYRLSRIAILFTISFGRNFLEQEHVVIIKQGHKLILGQLPVINVNTRASLM